MQRLRWTGRRAARVLLATALALACLCVAAASYAAEQVVNAQAQIAGSGTSYRLTVTNTGDEPILCFGLLLDGVQPTSASGPTGVLTRVGTFQGRGLVHMQGTPAAPALRPGTSVTVEFRTNVAIPPNAGGEIRYSSTCQPGSDVVGRATGPTPPPQAQPCDCRTLTATLADGRRLRTKTIRKGIAVEFQVRWTMACTGGAGRCNGRLAVAPVPSSRALGATASFHRARGQASLTCPGRCSVTSRGNAKLVVTSSHRAFQQPNVGRGDGRSISVEMARFCGRARAPLTFDLVFKRTGALDARLSDLNGNGIADGRE